MHGHGTSFSFLGSSGRNTQQGVSTRIAGSDESSQQAMGVNTVSRSWVAIACVAIMGCGSEFNTDDSGSGVGQGSVSRLRVTFVDSNGAPIGEATDAEVRDGVVVVTGPSGERGEKGDTGDRGATGSIGPAQPHLGYIDQNGIEVPDLYQTGSGIRLYAERTWWGVTTDGIVYGTAEPEAIYGTSTCTGNPVIPWNEQNAARRVTTLGGSLVHVRQSKPVKLSGMCWTVSQAQCLPVASDCAALIAPRVFASSEIVQAPELEEYSFPVSLAIVD